MKLTIDQIPCDLDPSQRIALDYDAQDLADVRSGNKGHALRLRLPATRTNDRIFGFAAEPYTGQRFNAAQHTAVLSDGEAKLLQGSVRLLSAAYDSDPEGYLIEIRSGTSEWARQVAAEMFNTLGISFSGRLTPTMIRQTWTNNTPVKFFPVCRDEYTPELSSVELIPVERFLSVDDYHPFISAATVVQTLFSEAGYTLESDFLNGEFFRSLYLSGAYSSRDTNALRNRMDFLARRTTTAATTANSDGRVYANPYKSINSVGNFVETVNPNDQNDLGETLTDVFSNNHCFTVEDGEIVFRPMTSVTVAFEYHIRYITDHRILDRNRLKGIDSFYLGDGTEVQGALANRYADRRNSTKPAFQYRAIVFNHTEGNSYRLTCTVNGTAGHAIGEFDSRSALVTTPSGSTVTAPVLLYKAAGSTTYTTYTGDWALYDGYIGETGQTEVEMTVRTNPVTVTPTSPKTFSTIYFYGAEPGMKFSLSRQCTLRPDFTGAPGLNTPISFEDVARHRVRKWVVLDALRHLFNLRFYTDEETRTVYVEPADDFYRLGQTFDWSSRIDRSQPILLGDAAQDAERVRIYKYREADGAVTRLNATLEEPFGQWRLVNDSAAAIDRERNLANPFFSPTVSETECYADAPSALVLRVGDRDAPDTTDRNSFTPRIVRYCGMQPLPAGERWAILPPETATPWPHSTVTIPTTGSRSASKTGTDNRDCTASTTPRPNRRNAASTSRSTCGSNRATSNGSFRYSASPPASPRRSCSASAAKRSAARSAASRVTTPRPPRPAAPSPVCPTDSPSTVLHPRGPQPYDSPHSHGMHSSKIRPTLLPERGRRETATIPPTANPIPNAGERAGKKQLSMQSDIQITNRNDTCFVDIEGVIGVPEEWQFDQPSSRVATYEKFRDSLDRLREIDAPEIVVNIRSTGGDVNDALLIYEALSSLDGHIVTRCYGYTASAATVIAQAASEGCREISAHALYLIHNSICTAEGNAEELATRIDLLRKTDARLAEVYAARSGRTPEEFTLLMAENNGSGRWLSPQEALAAGLVDRIIEPSATEKTPAAQATPAGQWRKLLGKLGLVRPADALPPDRNILHFGDPEKGLGPRTSELALHEGQQFAAPTRTLPREDPSIGETTPSANQRAYAEDAKQLIR